MSAGFRKSLITVIVSCYCSDNDKNGDDDDDDW